MESKINILLICLFLFIGVRAVNAEIGDGVTYIPRDEYKVIGSTRTLMKTVDKFYPYYSKKRTIDKPTKSIISSIDWKILKKRTIVVYNYYVDNEFNFEIEIVYFEPFFNFFNKLEKTHEITLSLSFSYFIDDHKNSKDYEGIFQKIIKEFESFLSRYAVKYEKYKKKIDF